MPVDYCLDKNLTGGSTVPVIKLHGSLNWSRCITCNGMIVSWPMAHLLQRFPIHRSGEPYTVIGNHAFIQVTSSMSGLIHTCRSSLENDAPVIVPPTWEKANHDQGFENMWAHAARHLAQAENIIVIGYSLPPSDQFFPMLYALGTVSETVLKRFWVFDPDKDDTVEKRFKGMLGEAALQRFMRQKLPFEDCFGYLEQLERDP